MDERERLERNRSPYDPATPGESATIHYALKTVLMGIREARRIIRGVRVSNESRIHWSRSSEPGTNWMGSSVGRIQMADDLRRQLREVEQALVALGEVVAVRREYVTLLQRLGSHEKELAALDALTQAQSRLQLQRDNLAASLASRAR